MASERSNDSSVAGDAHHDNDENDTRALLSSDSAGGASSGGVVDNGRSNDREEEKEKEKETKAKATGTSGVADEKMERMEEKMTGYRMKDSGGENGISDASLSLFSPLMDDSEATLARTKKRRPAFADVAKNVLAGAMWKHRSDGIQRRIGVPKGFVHMKNFTCGISSI